MKIIILCLLWTTLVLSMKVDYKQWKKNQTFSDYLGTNHISKSLLQSISDEDKKFLLEIRSNSKYCELKDKNGILYQVLIPINEEMQIHLFKKPHLDEYGFDIISVTYQNKEYFGKITVERNPYSDALSSIQSPQLAKRLSLALDSSDIDTQSLQKGDEIAFIYMQKTRLGELYAMPKIQLIKISTRKKEQYVYTDGDGYGYKEVKRKKSGNKKVVYGRRSRTSKRGRFGMPLRHTQITSGFSYRRWHPLLHRYRPHQGTDFRARKGTPLRAVNDGRIIFSGWMGGYGRVVKIRHAGGYVSLYAHQSRIRVKRGQRVRKGQIIGYSGNSGRSTGPHLHFGLTRYGHWINPMRVLRKKSIGNAVLKKFAITDIEKSKEKLNVYLANNTPSYIWGQEWFSRKLRDTEVVEVVENEEQNHKLQA
ncbi:MAG: peptidoglycan DD-metalloendopeptidase family protein [Sulfurovum sp.]|nr:peptidoglycan DD-metalloendopeptidase family protein [Sulfurovum sp.]